MPLQQIPLLLCMNKLDFWRVTHVRPSTYYTNYTHVVQLYRLYCYKVKSEIQTFKFVPCNVCSHHP